MVIVLMVVQMFKRYSSMWERLLWAVFIVFLLSPFSILGAGFWLSFGALAIILFTISTSKEKSLALQEVSDEKSQRNIFLKVREHLKTFWGIQWRLCVGLGVLQGVLFGGLSIHSVWANFVLVPWFSFVVIPLSLLSGGTWALGQSIGSDWSFVMQIASASITPLDWTLRLSQMLPWGWQPVSSEIVAQLIFLIVGVLLWQAHKGLMWRLVSFSMVFPLMMTAKHAFDGTQALLPLKPSSTQVNGFAPYVIPWRVHLLDVGQGLSVVVERQGRAMIYDTGASFGAKFSYAERVILPFFAYQGIRQLDYLFLSHGDNDHAGGASVLRQAFPQARVVTDIEQYQGIRCRPQSFNWQGLSVSILAPAWPRKGNNGSCVVQVGDGLNKVMLPGDIEKAGEKRLLASFDEAPHQLRSQVLIAPHHGSKSSSTPYFIDAVSPDWVLFPAGFHNRWGFPKPEVVARYHSANRLVTGEQGQITLTISNSGIQGLTYRRNMAPFWYNRLLGFGTKRQARVE
ncbi:hypothetical protein GCM10009332_12000 [Shewanella gelidii]|uniref:Metallo-beta-lactamase domain-containing protein n=2 Tax=Shewanella gelidii TaxID=1642821 RepID=A0A917JMZ7_9GAMM|nr:hypothetical protein GCM10009332_12000 [Shewanella gelidii]